MLKSIIKWMCTDSSASIPYTITGNGVVSVKAEDLVKTPQFKQALEQAKQIK